MKKLLLLLALLTTITFPQLKEMEIKLTERKGAIPVFRDYGDKAAIFFYALFDNLTFESNWKIVHVYNKTQGNYVVIIEPKHQTLQISSAGFKTEILRIPDIAARECLFYTVEPKKDTDVVQGIKELAVTIQTVQPDAKITIDGKEVKNNTATFFTIGTHTLKVEKTGFLVYTKEIEVSTANTLFQVTLESNDPVEVSIIANQKTGKLQVAINPEEAECILSENGIEKQRWKGLKILNEINEGSYGLTVKASDYKTFTKKIIITENQTMIEDIQLEKGSDVPENLVYVEGGSFNMGSSDYDYEKPIHRVTVSSFYIGRTEVTVKEYKAYCQATGTKMPNTPDWGWNDTDPIVNVGWNDAQGYCKWAGVRLPTEAEWEYAARGGNKSRGYEYSGSDNMDNVGWYDKNSNMKVHQVGKKQPNELGIYDMSGNVWEWCSDWYGGYKSNDQRDPTGVESGSVRVLRGGSWNDLDNDCRSSNRYYYYPGYGNYNIGFRVVRP